MLSHCAAATERAVTLLKLERVAALQLIWCPLPSPPSPPQQLEWHCLLFKSLAPSALSLPPQPNYEPPFEGPNQIQERSKCT